MDASTTASSTSSWAMCPHQVSTSVSARTSCVSPCSGSCRVAVRTSYAVAEQLRQARGDRAVHALRVQRANVAPRGLVEVLAPDGDPQRSRSHANHYQAGNRT